MFLGEPPSVEETEAAFARDLEEEGYVSNYIRLWAWAPGLCDAFADLRGRLIDASPLGDRDWALLMASTTSQIGDSYCSLAWAEGLADLFDVDTAAQILARGPVTGLSDREAALRDWARKVVKNPNGTTPEDVARLRTTGLSDKEIFDATVFIAFRLAFAMVNDALGASPDRQMVESISEPLRNAVSYGREPSTELSPTVTSTGGAGAG